MASWTDGRAVAPVRGDTGTAAAEDEKSMVIGAKTKPKTPDQSLQRPAAAAAAPAEEAVGAGGVAHGRQCQRPSERRIGADGADAGIGVVE